MNTHTRRAVLLQRRVKKVWARLAPVAPPSQENTKQTHKTLASRLYTVWTKKPHPNQNINKVNLILDFAAAQKQLL